MADDRTYIRVHDGLDENPKVEGLSDAAFRLLITCWCYSGRNLTDGRLTTAAWKKRGTPKARRELVEAGLVDEGQGFVEMHDYLEHQRSAEEVRLLRETRGDTGTYGNHVRWHVVKRKPKSDCEHCQKDAEAVANESQTRSQTDRKPIASSEAEAEAEAERNTSSRGVSHVSSDSPSEPPLYPDRCKKHGDTYEPPNCGACADVRKARLALASIGPHNPATKPHCGECDEVRLFRTRFGTIPCPNCNPAAEAS